LADPEGDAALVERLARWAGRWSPLVEVDGESSLRLDVTGVAHLFGGEAELVADVQTRFAVAGLSTRVAIAPTAAAAWALAHFGKAGAVICGKDTGAKLADLPVAALRLPAEATQTLQRLGLKTIGTLAGIERRSLARRFREADNPVDALDRALGRKPEPLTAVSSVRPPRALLKLEEPATHPEAPMQALERLIPDLVQQFQRRHLGARRLALIGYRVDGSTAVASVATSIPSREPKHLQRLIADKAAALDPGFGFDAFALQADWTESLASAQDSLVGDPSSSQEVARLIDRLSVKLGPDKVRRPQPFESHLPERASGWRPALDKVEKVEREQTACRPQRLLDRPEAIDVIYATPEGKPRRFVWRRAVHDIARVEGPERIAPEWWRERSTARLRDYYRVEDREGRRYWIYREGLVGDGRGGLPEWYMHGLFG
jgi:protein ImuB